MDDRGERAREAAPTALPYRMLVHRRPRRAALLIGLGFAILVLLTPLLGGLFGWIGALLGFASAISAFIMSSWFAVQTRAAGEVLLGPTALELTDEKGERTTVPFAEITSGYEAPTERAAVLLLRGGAQLLVALDGDGPKRLLEHAGVGPTQRALTVPLRRTLGAFTIGFTSFWGTFFLWSVVCTRALPLFGPVVLAVALLLAVASTVLICARFAFPRVVVGTDGIRTLGILRQRFIPYEEIARAALVPNPFDERMRVLHVILRNGTAVVLPTITAPREQLEGLARRIDEGARAHARGKARPVDALGRGGRTADAWKHDITKMALAPGGFRDHALERDDFERVLGDAAAPPDQRIGAALALKAMDPAAGPARIRVAADASANEALRDALVAAAEGEIDEPLLDRAAPRRASPRS